MKKKGKRRETDFSDEARRNRLLERIASEGPEHLKKLRQEFPNLPWDKPISPEVLTLFRQLVMDILPQLGDLALLSYYQPTKLIEQFLRDIPDKTQATMFEQFLLENQGLVHQRIREKLQAIGHYVPTEAELNELMAQSAQVPDEKYQQVNGDLIAFGKIIIKIIEQLYKEFSGNIFVNNQKQADV